VCDQETSWYEEAIAHAGLQSQRKEKKRKEKKERKKCECSLSRNIGDFCRLLLYK
jgi:hypothetical protein